MLLSVCTFKFPGRVSLPLAVPVLHWQNSELQVEADNASASEPASLAVSE